MRIRHRAGGVSSFAACAMRQNFFIYAKTTFAFSETIPQIVWIATPDDGLDYCNHRLFELTGQPAEQSRGNGWHQIIHPDDLPAAVANWEKTRRNGTPID